MSGASLTPSTLAHGGLCAASNATAELAIAHVHSQAKWNQEFPDSSYHTQQPQWYKVRSNGLAWYGFIRRGGLCLCLVP